MKHVYKRVCKIVDELFTYLVHIGATDITTRFIEDEDSYKISVKCNYSTNDPKKIEKLVKYLQCEKSAEMEEYYWELAGDSDVDTELTLVGMMCDEKEINITDDRIELSLVRYKG